MTKKETLYIYTRVSTEEQQNKDLSLPRQKDLGIEKAKILGMDYELFIEGGESASLDTFENRPEFMKLFELVKEGVVKNLFVFDPTRLSRNDFTKTAILVALKRAEVKLYTNSKDYDFNKLEDEFTFKIMQATETFDSGMRKARFQLGYVSANKKGRYLKLMPPYGYKKDDKGYLIIDEEEKVVFLQIVDRYLRGDGTNKIARWLNDENIPTKSSKILKNGYTLKRGISNRKNSIHKTNNRWNPGTVMSILKRELNTGKRRFKTGKNTYEYVSCEPLIDEATYQRILTIKASNAINKRKEDKYFYLLKGLVQCGNCESPMHGRIKPNRKEYTYRCNSRREVGSKCTGRGINIGKLNAIIWNAYVSSQFYQIQINNFIREQMSDNGLLNTRLNQLESQLKNLDIQEKQVKERIKNLVKKSIDPRVQGLMYEELMDELDKEAKIIHDNKRMCLYTIKTLTEQIKDNENANSELQKGFRLFINAKNELDLVWPPFENKEIELKARRILRNCIRSIKVEYIPAEMKHKIEVTFNEIGIRHDFLDKEPYTHKKVEVLNIEVGHREKVVFERAIPFPDKITILNDDPKFRKQCEKDYKTFQKAKKNHENKIGQKLPTLKARLHH